MLFYLQFTLLALLQSDIDTDDSDFGRRVLVGTLLQFERTVHIGHRAPAELCTSHIEIEPGGTRTLIGGIFQNKWWRYTLRKKEAGVAGRWRSPRPRVGTGGAGGASTATPTAAALRLDFRVTMR